MNSWVVKLGGSLIGSRMLRDWLRVLARVGAGRVVVVPGGGPFADQVRDVQASWEFNDKTAHHMALLAMEQYAVMLCGMQEGLIPAADVASIQAALKRGLTPVWMPVSMALKEDCIPQNWSVTSDSLAAWLASRLTAQQLVLIKTEVRGGTSDASVEQLQERGVVDPYLAEALNGASYNLAVLDAGDSARFEASLTALTS